jgi:hypothetical protein
MNQRQIIIAKDHKVYQFQTITKRTKLKSKNVNKIPNNTSKSNSKSGKNSFI